jgi:tryptophanase
MRTSSSYAAAISAQSVSARIAHEVFCLADGCYMSAKKDALVNIGGFIALRSQEWIERLRALLILTEGFPTYGASRTRILRLWLLGLKKSSMNTTLNIVSRSLDTWHRVLMR